MILLHITSQAAWDAAQAEGAFRVESLETEGFIHASLLDYFMTTAAAEQGAADALRAPQGATRTHEGPRMTLSPSRTS